MKINLHSMQKQHLSRGECQPSYSGKDRCAGALDFDYDIGIRAKMRTRNVLFIEHGIMIRTSISQLCAIVF